MPAMGGTHNVGVGGKVAQNLDSPCWAGVGWPRRQGDDENRSFGPLVTDAAHAPLQPCSRRRPKASRQLAFPVVSAPPPRLVRNVNVRIFSLRFTE